MRVSREDLWLKEMPLPDEKGGASLLPTLCCRLDGALLPFAAFKVPLTLTLTITITLALALTVTLTLTLCRLQGGVRSQAGARPHGAASDHAAARL